MVELGRINFTFLLAFHPGGRNDKAVQAKLKKERMQKYKEEMIASLEEGRKLRDGKGKSLMLPDFCMKAKRVFRKRQRVEEGKIFSFLFGEVQYKERSANVSFVKEITANMGTCVGERKHCGAETLRKCQLT
ncbi:hypothetical protein R1flu_008103 [Riccia fluitans]|uniref:Uncharacterized protein n=1 Tax=Riccia fluitans TaxID=41844 RepID=A0ABD1YAR7_9MARC